MAGQPSRPLTSPGVKDTEYSHHERFLTKTPLGTGEGVEVVWGFRYPGSLRRPLTKVLGASMVLDPYVFRSSPGTPWAPTSF